MGQRKTSKGLDSLSRATDILSTLLAQQVRELNARQRENRRINFWIKRQRIIL